MKGRARSLLFGLLVLLGTGLGTPTPSPAGQASLEAGFAVVDVTPDRPVPLGGYAARHGHPLASVHDPVHARAMALRQGERRFLLVSVDLVGVSARLRRLVGDRLRDLALDDFVLTATHTHAGPGGLSDVPLWRPAMGPFDRALFVRTAARIEAAARAAWAALRPARLEWGRREDDVTKSLVRNRATPGGPVDASLGVVRIDTVDGRPLGILVHFAAHPTIVSDQDLALSAGWPGALVDALERAVPGATALFLQGAMGDVSPVAPKVEGDHYARATAYGETLAREALALWHDLPGAGRPGTLEVGGTREALGRTIATRLLGQDGPSDLVPRPYPLPVSTFTAGPEFVTVPGEPVQAVGRALAGTRGRWVVACAGDHVGYFTDRALFRRGRYEADLSLFGPDATELLVRAASGDADGDEGKESGRAGHVAAPPGNAPVHLVVPPGTSDTDAPRALGRAHGHALRSAIRDLLRRTEPVLGDALLGQTARFALLPYGLALRLPPTALVVPALVREARRLQPEIPTEYLDEMEGIAEASGVPYDAVLLENLLFARSRTCRATDLVAVGDATSLGQLLHGLCLRGGLGTAWKQATVVLVVEPRGGHPFAAVTWPGMVGAPAALGAQGVAVTEGPAVGPADASEGGLPQCVLVRDIAEHAASLQDAVRRIGEGGGVPGATLVVSDGRELDARVVGRRAGAGSVRAPEKGLLVAPDVPSGPAGGSATSGAPEEGAAAAIRAFLEPRRQRIRLADAEGALGAAKVLGPDPLFALVLEPEFGRLHLARGTGVGPKPGGHTWTDYALSDLLSPEARAETGPPWPVAQTGEVTTEVRGTHLGGVREETVTFSSPVRSGNATNDRVVARLFSPKDPVGVVIQLPWWKEPRGAPAQKLIALALASRGLAVLVLPLPWQASRAPPGVGSGELTLSRDLCRAREAALQGAADVCRASLWLERARGFPPSRQGVLGISLGGHVASLAMGAYPGRFAAGAFLLTGEETVAHIFVKNGVTDRVRAALLARGVTPEEARRAVPDMDAGTWARPTEDGRILLIGGTKDAVVPPEAVEALAKAWGGARVEFLEGDHVGALVRHAIGVLALVNAHFQKWLRRR